MDIYNDDLTLLTFVHFYKLYNCNNAFNCIKVG